ncbi:hypothetical protein N7492_007061 [Penicillium capsulatum]|uniref:Uncharacterized protein n=1 Tax=Penicillium capsulatum TaxID=69766 RepID=A0A9W9HZ33_9EURO|nr:hypothetical protein N7492_007061 [Penicillium capsulatum]KAJ6116895.1 hypothetical protein N7512_006620 [Penicillium capsulatum]
MDLQGNPLPHGPRSTKVTNDPLASQQPIEEPSGPVPNDSLAAESVRKGGAFSGNRDAEPTSMSNPNTSHATTLPSAPVGGLREDRQRQEKYPEALGGQGNFPGAHLPESGYTGGPTAAKQELGIGGDAAASGSQRSQYNAGQAPSSINDITDGYKHQTPGGRNVHEGGFSSNPNKNASFNSEIGSSQDPGRAALNKFQRTTAENGPATGPYQKGVDNQTPYQVLDRDQRA